MSIRSFQFVAIILVAFVLGLGPEREAWSQVAPRGSASSAAIISAPDSKFAKSAHDEQYVIGGDDVLALNVWNETEFKQVIPVRPDGKIPVALTNSLGPALIQHIPGI